MENKNNFTHSPVKSKIFQDDAEYIAFMEAVKACLLNTFDKVSYRADIYHDGLQTLVVEMGTDVDRSDSSEWILNQYWISQITIFADKGVEEFRAGKLELFMESSIDLLRYQMQSSIPKYYAVRFPEG